MSQTLEIASLTGELIYCVETNKMINSNTILYLREATIFGMKVIILNDPDKFLKHTIVGFRRKIILLKYKFLLLTR
ncbi:MAG: hypothetical protein ACTSX9_09655 [Candidatus Njordarchaeales archaeon]